MLNPLPELDLYFSTSPLFSNQFIKNIWSKRDDFLYIHRNFNNISKEIWIPFRSMVVDETLVQFDGRYKYKQHIKGKPSNTGIKLYLFSDSEWFVYRLWPYCGHQPPVHILVWDFVTSLPSYKYSICTDSYFGHHKTAAVLNSLGFRFTLNCVASRLGKNCKEVLDASPIQKGEWISVTNGDYVVVRFSDKKVVNFITNEITIDAEQTRGKEPPSVKDIYEKKHVNVDVSDRYANMYSGSHRMHKWTNATWFGIFKVILVNSWLYHKKATKSDTKYISFLAQVAIGLARKGGAFIDEEGRKSTSHHSMEKVHDHHGHKCHMCNTERCHTRCINCHRWLCCLHESTVCTEQQQ